MAKWQILHNPRCTKSRQTLQLLQDNGIEPEVIEYLKTPPSASELKNIAKKLGSNAEGFVRKKEGLFKELELKDASDKELIEAMAKNPILIERPIVINDGKAVIGRPPENVKELI